MFQEALADGTAEAFFSLMEQFRTQDEPAMCGPAALVMVLNAFGVDPGQLWKGPWRWYHEQNLDCCKSPQDIAREGMEWEELICLSRCQGLDVEAVRIDEEEEALGIADFEAHCAASCSMARGAAIVVSYSRKSVSQDGDGHYSPLGAYNRCRSYVLVLDTARFKYPPHWLPVHVLWEAMRAVSESSGRSRGYAILRNGDAISPSACCSMKQTWRAWTALATWIAKDSLSLASNLEAAAETIAEAELWELVRGFPPAVASLVSVIDVTCTDPLSPDYCERCAGVMRALRRTKLYAALNLARQRRHPRSTLPNSLESITMLVMLLGDLGLLDEALPHARAAELWKWLPGSDDKDDLALQQELTWLLQKAEEVRAAVAAHESCCRFHGCGFHRRINEESQGAVASCCSRQPKSFSKATGRPTVEHSFFRLAGYALSLALLGVIVARTLRHRR